MALSMMLLAKEVNKPDPWGKTSWQLGQLFGLTNFWPGTVWTENWELKTENWAAEEPLRNRGGTRNSYRAAALRNAAFAFAFAFEALKCCRQLQR